MVRFAHMGDLHIGSSHLNARAEDGRNQRLVDFENAAIAAAEDAVAQGIDFVVFAGDTFDAPNLMPAALTGLIKVLQVFQDAGVRVIVIGGNHDVAEAEGRYNALQFAADHHGIELHLDQDHLDVENVRLHLVSYRVMSRAQRGRGDLKPFDFSDSHENVLVAHGYAPGEGVREIPEGTDTEIPEEWLQDRRFKLCLLGHIHHHGQVADRVFFSGSTERRNFGEVDELPGYFIHEIDDQGNVESISRPLEFSDIAREKGVPRPMVSEDVDTSSMTVFEVDRKVRDIIERAPEGSMLRVRLDNVSDSIDSETRKSWEKHHSEHGGFHFEATVRTKRVSELLAVDFAEPPEDLGKGIAEFINQQEMTDDRDEVLGLMDEVISEAREMVLSQESSD